MKKNKCYVLVGVVVSLFLLSACSQSTYNGLTLAKAYPKMYEEKPTTILVMPPINNTEELEAKDYFYTSLALPLCERGYYVLSPLLALDFLKSESAYDSELFIKGKLKAFHTYLGADALLFTTIDAWNKSAVGATIEVQITYELRSARTNSTLFKRHGHLVIDKHSNQGGLAGLLANAIVTGLSKKITAARACNAYVLSDLPDGPYQKLHLKDGDSPASSPVFEAVLRR